MKILLFLLVIFPFTLTAQNVDEWGKVNSYYKNLTVYEQDTTAEAVILFDVGDLTISYDNWQYTFQHRRRIKLLKESSLNRGTIKIPYYSGNNLEALNNLKAQAIAPDGTVVKLSKKDFFREKNDKGYSYINFAVPNLAIGTIIEYQYEIISSNVVELREWYFQHDIPVLYSRLKTAAPDLLPYLYLFQGSEYLKKIDENTYSFHEEGKLKIQKNLYEMWNVPAVKAEAYMTSYNDYRARIRFQLEKILGKDNTNFTGESYYVKKELLSSWANMAVSLQEHDSFGEQYLKKRNYKNLLANISPLLATAKTEQEKAKIVYEYLTENVELSYPYGIFAEERLDKMFEKKVTNKGGINLMLLSMLKAQDIEAYPVLTSTRNHGKMLPEHAIFDQFNYLMVQAKLDGKLVLLDVGNSLRPMGYPALNALNYKAWVMNGERSHWINLDVPSSHSVFQLKCQMEDRQLKGHIRTKYNGYSAISERDAYQNSKDGKYWQDRFTNDLQLENFQVKNEETIKKDFYNEFDVSLEEQLFENEDFIYISPIVYSSFDENPFKSKKRYSSIDFPYQFFDQYLFELTIPEGYEVEQLPDMANVVLPKNGGSFQYRAMEGNGKVKITSSIKFKQLNFSPSEYPTIKTLFDIIVEKHGEQIVLKKISEDDKQ
ncbi:MAG: DUF3857 domain-containing protein [Bacteroidota bacterium]